MSLPPDAQVVLAGHQTPIHEYESVASVGTAKGKPKTGGFVKYPPHDPTAETVVVLSS
jgi:hypothetical protein